MATIASQIELDKNTQSTMKAVAVRPGEPSSAHLRDIPRPKLTDIPNGRGVLVKVLRVGVDGTDREIYDAEYGAAPAGDDYLVVGHESLGVVCEVGDEVADIAPGDHVVATVRRPGKSIYDRIGMSDMTTDDTYYERGINLRHGFLTEYYVEDPEFLVKLPAACLEVGVLVEPASIVAKALVQAWDIQRRLKVWRPSSAAVMGAGTIGLLATLMLRLRGLEVTTFGLEEPPYLNSNLIGELGARYVSVRETPMLRDAADHGPWDLVLEATGVSQVAFESTRVLAKNGILILTSVTGGDRKLEIPADQINLDFVLGNRVMVGTVNANRDHFEVAVGDLVRAYSLYPGWLPRLLTHPVRGLENFEELYQLLKSSRDAIKIFMEL